MLVSNLSIRGKHKFADHWEEGPYQVVECIPIYNVQDKNSKERVPHRNLLLPFRGPPSAPAASPQPVRPKQPLQFKHRRFKLRPRTFKEEDIDDELYTDNFVRQKSGGVQNQLHTV